MGWLASIFRSVKCFYCGGRHLVEHMADLKIECETGVEMVHICPECSDLMDKMADAQRSKP